MNNPRLGTEWLRYKELQTERPALFADNGPIHIVWDETIVEKYEKEHNRKIGVLYESPYNMLVVDLVYETEGRYFAYERLIPAVATGAVVIMPLLGDKVILLRQYRHALRDYQYSFPRGFGEKGLTVEQNLRKELMEEIGATVTETNFLGTITPDSGVQANCVSIYACHIDAYDANLRSEGICDILEVEQDEVRKLATEGRITDGFTLAALGLYHDNTFN